MPGGNHLAGGQAMARFSWTMTAVLLAATAARAQDDLPAASVPRPEDAELVGGVYLSKIRALRDDDRKVLAQAIAKKDWDAAGRALESLVAALVTADPDRGVLVKRKGLDGKEVTQWVGGYREALALLTSMPKPALEAYQKL